jgi:hypothetical protein
MPSAKKKYSFEVDVAFDEPNPSEQSLVDAMHKRFKKIYSFYKCGDSFIRFKSVENISLSSEKDFCQSVKSVVQKAIPEPCQIEIRLQHVPKLVKHKVKIG